MATETHSDNADAIACPHFECGTMMHDLWDHHWNGRSCIETECHECGRPIVLIRHESVSYACKVG